SVSSLSFTSDQAIFAGMRLGSGHSEIPAIGENAIESGLPAEHGAKNQAFAVLTWNHAAGLCFDRALTFRQA
ncbi:MAG: hypothetical protein WCK86_16805, partial [Planctomycetia bacterium]